MSYLGDGQHQPAAGDGTEGKQLTRQPSSSPKQLAQQLPSQQSPQTYQVQNRLLQSSQWSKSYDSVINYWNTTGPSAVVATAAGYQQHYAGGYSLASSSAVRQSFLPPPYYHDLQETSPHSVSSASSGSPPAAPPPLVTSPALLQGEPQQAATRSSSGKRRRRVYLCDIQVALSKCAVGSWEWDVPPLFGRALIILRPVLFSLSVLVDKTWCPISCDLTIIIDSSCVADWH